jgi:hypothetical protein
MLNPLQPARSKIGSWSQSWLIFKYFEVHLCCLKSVALFIDSPPADGEHLATNFPDMRAAPLNNICCCGKRFAERVESFVVHCLLCQTTMACDFISYIWRAVSSPIRRVNYRSYSLPRQLSQDRSNSRRLKIHRKYKSPRKEIE